MRHIMLQCPALGFIARYCTPGLSNQKSQSTLSIQEMLFNVLVAADNFQFFWNRKHENRQQNDRKLHNRWSGKKKPFWYDWQGHSRLWGFQLSCNSFRLNCSVTAANCAKNWCNQSIFCCISTKKHPVLPVFIGCRTSDNALCLKKYIFQRRRAWDLLAVSRSWSLDSVDSIRGVVLMVETVEDH